MYSQQIIMVKSFSFKGVNVSGDVNSCVSSPTKSMNIEPTVEQWCSIVFSLLYFLFFLEKCYQNCTMDCFCSFTTDFYIGICHH